MSARRGPFNANTPPYPEATGPGIRPISKTQGRTSLTADQVRLRAHLFKAAADYLRSLTDADLHVDIRPDAKTHAQAVARDIENWAGHWARRMKNGPRSQPGGKPHERQS